MRAHLRIPHAARALTAAALGLATAALTGTFAGPALAASTPGGPALTAGRPLPAPLSKHALLTAVTGDSAAAATLTGTPSSVPNGASFTFRYSVPAKDLNSASENRIGVYEPGQTPGVASLAYLFFDNGYRELAGPADLTVAPSKPAPAPRFARSIGQYGRGHLSDPFAVAVAPGGSLWVADRSTSRVEHFTASGRYLRTIGAGRLGQPDGLAVDAHGNVWVADTGQDKIVEFAPSGRVLRSFGRYGTGKGRLSHPPGLALGSGGAVWVADQGNNRLEEFSVAGAYRAQIPVASPWSIAIDRAGHLWVSSPSYADGNAVYEFRPGDTSSLRYFGSTQASYGALSDPAGIAIGPGGRIYLAQPDYGFVTVLNPGGSFYTEFGLQQGAVPGGARDLAFPYGLAVTAGGTVYVADSGNGRIVEFSPAAGATANVPPAGFGWRTAGGALVVLAVLGLLIVFVRRRVTVAARTAAALAPAPLRAASSPAAGQAAGSRLIVSRRTLISGATALAGAAAGATILPATLSQALASTLRSTRPAGSIMDIEHIVILMQENRSFDHYYGTMPGVRGFSDPAAITLPTGNPVFCQPDPAHAQGYLLPFHYDTARSSAQATPATDHSWPTQHRAWDSGKMDQWIPAKGEYTMGYFRQDDIPFHWALAEAFTICDNYHCSVFGPTNPNRLYMWTGMIDPRGTGGGPIIDDTPAFDNVILSWTTYPERLEKAGISWKVYQEEDNYDDNALAWFRQYARAPSWSPLRQRGISFGLAGDFETDARAGRLPQVSWLVAPTAQSEHPDYFPAAGAEYIAQKLDAIASNPDLWARTAFILCYDENDGLFDHVPPPVAPAGTAGEFVDGLNIGLGFRTPTTIISPWTAGGFVCSELFDHSSLIRFIEARFGVAEPNISAWRRRECGDLTSAFRFSAQPRRYPSGSGELGLPVTESRLLRAQQQVNDLPVPAIPAVNEPLPRQ